jgi:6-phosphogluconate dehydrogenase (decarboxylating)
MRFYYHVYSSPPLIISLCFFLRILKTQFLPSVNFQGRNLVVYDVQQEAVNSLKELGATVSQSPQDVAAQVDCVITMLPSNACVLEVYKGENGILK